MPDEPLWTVDDVAAFLRVAPKTIRHWQTSRRLPFLKVGGTVRFLPDEIRRWATNSDEANPIDAAGVDSSGTVARAQQVNHVLSRHAKASNLTRRK